MAAGHWAYAQRQKALTCAGGPYLETSFNQIKPHKETFLNAMNGKSQT